MTDTKSLVLGGHYRVDARGTLERCITNARDRVLISDIAIGTKFRTQGSTASLREKHAITHACLLEHHFDERGKVYFMRENGQHIELADCADLRLMVLELPYIGH